LKVEVLNTGTELLLGSIVNTHAAWLGRALFPLGLRIERQTTVPDGEAIRDAMRESFSRCDVLLVTGGLGPTTDDLTREITADLLGRELRLDEEILRAIQERCARRGFAFQERMGRQTMVPEGATVLPNANGTAPGLYLPATATTPHIFLLPGPPRELRPMFAEFVLPRLRELAGEPGYECRTYRCVGIGESAVEARLGLALTDVPGLEVGYCARPNEVDLRLIGAPALLEAVEPRVLAQLGEFIVSSADEELEALVVTKLRELGKSIATAESCTGGLLANRITNISGASEIFRAGWVTYANEVKTAELGVDPVLLAELGAVSEPVARQMAEGALAQAGADFALATTGVAGPGGGSEAKPVGTVFLALAAKGQSTHVWREFFPTDRTTFKQLTTQAALVTLLKRLRA
jgi:nicotinamide-nucleotide amidase